MQIEAIGTSSFTREIDFHWVFTLKHVISDHNEKKKRVCVHYPKLIFSTEKLDTAPDGHVTQPLLPACI